MSRRTIFMSCLFYPFLANAASIHKFNLPGYLTTCGTAIASNGLVAGLANGGETGGSAPFLRYTNKFSTPSYGLPPGVVYYEGVNRSGDLVGFEITENFTVTPFRIHAGSVTLIAAASVNAITDNGTMLEEVATQPAQGFGPYYVGVVVRPNGATTVLDDGTGQVQPAGMDAHGERVVGTSLGPNGEQAWMFHAHKFTPVAVPGALLTNPSGVDQAGRVSGTYYSGDPNNPVSHGFLLQDGVYTSWDVPGASSTEILGGNNSGQITGCYADQTGEHGFWATP